MGRLTEREREMLDLAGQWWNVGGLQDQAIRDLFDMSPTRFWQQVNVLCERPEALEYAPLVAKRLWRLRSARGDQRARRALRG
jgi:hypothetical protein